MIMGTALVAAALSLFLYNRWEAGMAGRAAGAALAGVKDAVGENRDGSDPYGTELPETEIDGYRYIGYLSVPGLGLELPVISDWDYRKLKTAPCRYTGSARTNDMVIAAHNYDRHFGGLSKLSEGDPVFFVDMDGVIYEYAVATVDVLPPTAVEEMTAGDYDLTLFTCTYGGQSRVTVRCDRTDQIGKVS